MTWLLWAFAALLLGGTGFALWRFFSDPVKVARLIEFVASQAFQVALREIMTRKPPEEEALDGDAFKTGERRPTKQHPHPGEGRN